MSKSWSKYYDSTKALEPSRFLIEAISNYNLKPGKALDLGCGAGRDTKHLLKKGFEVTAIDGDSAAEKYIRQLPHQDKLAFICSGFNDFEFGSYDLVNAHYALPFSGKDDFDSVMEKVINSINAGGVFVGQLFGVNDEWNTPESQLIFHERSDVSKLFEGFQALEIKEVNEQRGVVGGDQKHWHVFNITAQK